MSDEPVFRRLADAFAELDAVLEAIPDPQDRRIARDALRDALDRGAGLGEPADILAGSYALIETIHRGDHFEVLRLRQRDLGTEHALKTPIRERAGDPLLRRLLLAEALHQSRIAHPACLSMRALLRLPDGRPGLLTDFVPASTLAALLLRRRSSESETIALGLRLVEALGAVHAAGIVHGDLKPGNVFMPDEGASKAILFDFGIARPIGATWGAEDLAFALTKGGAAPEATDPEALADPSADIHGLGRVLRAALANSPAGAALHALLAELGRGDPTERPTLGDVADRLKSCGIRATDKTKSGSRTVVSQPGQL